VTEAETLAVLLSGVTLTAPNIGGGVGGRGKKGGKKGGDGAKQKKRKKPKVNNKRSAR
jgi:hypothetical protein